MSEEVIIRKYKNIDYVQLCQVQAAGYNGINDVFLGEYIDGQLRLTGYSK